MKALPDYIKTIVESKGKFIFYKKDGKKMPAFRLAMRLKDKEKLEIVKNTLGLRNKVYGYEKKGESGSKTILIVRDFGQIKNIIIPFFKNILDGEKRYEFKEWIEKMGSEEVDKRYRLINRLYKYK